MLSVESVLSERSWCFIDVYFATREAFRGGKKAILHPYCAAPLESQRDSMFIELKQEKGDATPSGSYVVYWTQFYN
jgi:hypothetical protein